MEDIQALNKCWPEFEKMLNGKPMDIEKVKPFFQQTALDVVKHKKRLGGNFVVAQAVPNRFLRDYMKEVVGSDVLFVTLHLTKETNAKRVESRHSGGDAAVKKGIIDFLNQMYDRYEDAQPGEENCITVNIGPEDSREHVMNNILKKVEEFGFDFQL